MDFKEPKIILQLNKIKLLKMVIDIPELQKLEI